MAQEWIGKEGKGGKGEERGEARGEGVTDYLEVFIPCQK